MSVKNTTEIKADPERLVLLSILDITILESSAKSLVKGSSNNSVIVFSLFSLFAYRSAILHYRVRNLDTSQHFGASLAENARRPGNET